MNLQDFVQTDLGSCTDWTEKHQHNRAREESDTAQLPCQRREAGQGADKSTAGPLARHGVGKESGGSARQAGAPDARRRCSWTSFSHRWPDPGSGSRGSIQLRHQISRGALGQAAPLLLKLWLMTDGPMAFSRTKRVTAPVKCYFHPCG